MSKQIYLIRNGEGHYKIGFTERNISKRLNELQTATATELQVICTFETKLASKIERILHRLHNSKRMKGEWFDLNINDVKGFEESCKSIEANLVFLEKNKIGL